MLLWLRRKLQFPVNYGNIKYSNLIVFMHKYCKIMHVHTHSSRFYTLHHTWCFLWVVWLFAAADHYDCKVLVLSLFNCNSLFFRILIGVCTADPDLLCSLNELVEYLPRRWYENIIYAISYRETTLCPSDI